jgi:hypothetical protein
MQHPFPSRHTAKPVSVVLVGSSLCVLFTIEMSTGQASDVINVSNMNCTESRQNTCLRLVV